MKDSLDMRYAMALFSLAKEKDAIAKYQKQIKQMGEVLNKNEELYTIFNSAFISKKDRFSAVERVFNGYEKDVINFLKVLIMNHRLNNYELIFHTFNSLANEEQNILEGIIYSTSKLEPKKIAEIEKALYQKKKKKVSLINRIDPSLIGGIKVVIDNHVYDYSIQNEINLMRSQLKA